MINREKENRMLPWNKKEKEQENADINGFDEQSYLEANADVYEALKTNVITSGYEHLQRYGLDEIQNGKRKFHPAYQVFDEIQYLDRNNDIKESVLQGVFQSGFEHFCKYGYLEIISGKRNWPQERSRESSELYVNGVYGYIEKLNGRYIEGWAGVEDKPSCRVSILFEKESIGTTFPSIERPDVTAVGRYRNGRGFKIAMPLETMRQLFEKDEPLPDRMILQLQVENVLLPQKYSFLTKQWLQEVAAEVIGDDFLYYVPFIGKGFEKFFSFTQTIDVLKKLETYKLDNVLKSEKESLVFMLANTQRLSEKDADIFIEYLYDHQDVLHILAKQLKKNPNEALIAVVNRVLNRINPLDAWQILQTTDSADVFDTHTIEQRLDEDKEIAYLAKHPHKIIPTWKQFEKRERDEKMFSFMGLLVFLQEYNKLSELEISPLELIPGSETEEIEKIQDHFMQKNASWEGLLVTLYLLSLGVSRKIRNKLVENLISKLDTFEYVNTSALYWLVKDKFDKDKDTDLLNEIIPRMFHAFDNKSLWYDNFVKKIAIFHLNLLLKHKNDSFFDTHKQYMYHYLLDREVVLDQDLLSEIYLDQESVLWLKNIEDVRQEAIALLGDKEQTEKLIDLLDTIAYLSPELVEKVKFEIFNYVLNLEEDTRKIEHAAYGMLQVGGEYDKLMAAAKLDDDASYAYYEKKLVDNTKKEKHESKNNYWYKQALHTRLLGQDQQEAFVKALYAHIVNNAEVNDEQLRLMQLLLSEVLLIVEEKGNLDIDVKEITEKLVEINDAIFVHLQVWLYALQLFSKDVKNDSLFDYQEFFNEDLCYESREKIKEILKVHDNKNVLWADAKALMKQAMIYPYTLVMVYSCQAYMNTRQKAIRETWHQRAKDLKIPCVFVVGGSDSSHMEDDMMYLAVEDTYEKLPQKSLEMFRFAHKEFAYEHFLKIDDDCFLNLDAYFSDDVLFMSDYYGRKLHRSIGTMDRIWHQKKSSTKEAQNAFDLSPEPSIYADGSTGYVLNRNACKKLSEVFDNPKTIQLIHNSFMEDKLIGDLLKSRGFTLSSANFTSVIYRKLNQKDEATFWEYNLFPKSHNDVKVLHCETEPFLQNVWSEYCNDKKFQSCKYFSNRMINNFNGSYDQQPFLEVLDLKKDRLQSAENVCVIVCKNEVNYLPALLRHHREIGIKHFIYIDNASNDTSLEYVLSQDDVSVFVTTQEYKHFRFSVDWLESIFSNFCYGKWVLVVDADELFVYDDFENQSIDKITTYAEENGYDSFLAPMVDMYNKDALSQAEITDRVPHMICNYFDNITSMDVEERKFFGPFSNSPVYAGGVRSRVFGKYNKAPAYSYLNQKYCLFRYQPTFKFIEGIHFMGNNKPAPMRTALLHFKYHAKFHEKVQEQIKSGQHWNGSQEYKRYLSKLEHIPDLSLYDANISLKYKSSVSLIEAGYIDKLQ